MSLKKPKSISHNGKRLSDILDAHERFFLGAGKWIGKLYREVAHLPVGPHAHTHERVRRE